MIRGDTVVVSWGSYKRWQLDEDDTYQVLVQTESDDFVEAQCENAEEGLIINSKQIGVCKLNTLSLMN